MTTDTSPYKSNKSLWAMLIYFILCFYYFGVILMTHFVDYPALKNIHEHIQPVLDIFTNRMTFICFVPAGLLLVSSIVFYWFNKGNFPSWTLISSVLLTIVSFGTTLFFIYPIHQDLPETGLTETIQSKLLSLSLNYQIIPAMLQVLLALVLLNNYLKDTKIIARWIFIIVFVLSFYSMGTAFVEMFVNYPHWTVIGENDWHSYRFSGGKFFEVFLLPNFFPFLLGIALFWLRPKGIHKLYVWLFWLSHLWIFISTAVYFVPKVQLPLNDTFSKDIISNLIKYDLLFRFPAELLLFFIAGKMLYKIGQRKISEKNA